VAVQFFRSVRSLPSGAWGCTVVAGRLLDFFSSRGRPVELLGLRPKSPGIAHRLI
jgi:hypothetical protein